MKLAYQKSGGGRPLVILHGLYGSSDNWHTISRALATSFEVYLVDQRNHGRSPHHPDHTYGRMCEDLHEFLDAHGIEKPILLGHSMGGKTAMLFAMKYPRMVDRLVVVDISPAEYDNPDQRQFTLTHEKIISALQLIDPVHISNRNDADRMLQRSIPQPAIRQFLLKNLKTEPEGGYRWVLNLDAISNHMANLAAGVPGSEAKAFLPVAVPALFIKGETSPYILEEDIILIHKLFPSAQIVTIPDAGHWVHAEKPELFKKVVLDFLQPGLGA